MRTQPSTKMLQKQCDEFNAICPIGGAVTVKRDGVDVLIETTTVSEAQIMSGHSAVVWLKGISGFYSLECVTPIVLDSHVAFQSPSL